MIRTGVSWEAFSSILLFIVPWVTAGASHSARLPRGASIYPVFPSSHYMPPTFHTANDPTAFIHYLGGSGSTNNRRSGSEGSYSSSSSPHSSSSSPASSYSSPPARTSHNNYPPASATASTALDSSVLNAYMLSSQHGGSGGNRRSSSGHSPSGWAPSSSYGNSGGYTYDFGHITPNFASASTTHATYAQPPRLPTLDAHTLLHSATATFQAQNHLYNVLLEGVPRPRTYKKSSGGY